MSELVISNIDDLVAAKLEVHALSKGHVRPKGHLTVPFHCETCNRISDLTAQIAKHQRDRAAWLGRVRRQDKKEYNRLMDRIANFKRRKLGTQEEVTR